MAHDDLVAALMSASEDEPKLIELEMREEDIEAVIQEYEAANPGKAAREMLPSEFAERMLKKILATVTVTEGGNA